MALKDDMEEVLSKFAEELGGLDDFVFHTNFVWHSFLLSDNDVKDKTTELVNPTTGKEITLSELEEIFKRKYQESFLLAFTFQHMITTFEAAYFDLLRLLLLDAPVHRLAKSRRIEVSEVLSVSDYASVVELIVERELNELKYKKVSAWITYLHKLVKISSPTNTEIGRVAEVKAARDLLIHNSGVVNKIYLDKAGKHGRYQEGETVEISSKYHRQTSKLLLKVIKDIVTKTKAKL